MPLYQLSLPLSLSPFVLLPLAAASAMCPVPTAAVLATNTAATAAASTASAKAV
jgi:hypothetical protein